MVETKGYLDNSAALLYRGPIQALLDELEATFEKL